MTTSYTAGGARATLAVTASVPSLSAAANTDISMSWPALGAVPKVAVSVVSDHAGDGLVIRRVRSITSSGCVVNVANTGLVARTGEVQCIVIP